MPLYNDRFSMAHSQLSDHDLAMANAVKGHDAFLGSAGIVSGSDDEAMNGEKHAAGDISMSGDSGMDANTTVDRPWQDPELGYHWIVADGDMGELPPPGFVEEAAPESNPGMSIPMDVDVFGPPEQPYVGNGTIDPSLLAGPSGAPGARSRTPSPAPSALSSLTASPVQPLSQRGATTAKNGNGKKKKKGEKAKGANGGKGGKSKEKAPEWNEWATPGKYPKIRPKTMQSNFRGESPTEGRVSTGGKGKGKGRAEDVGYRARLVSAGVESDVGGAANGAENGLAGKRARKLSTRAKEAREHDLSVVEKERAHAHADRGATSSDDEFENEDHGPAGEKRMTQAEIDRLALEVPYCHQCRTQNKYEKVRCSSINDNGEPCGLQFCEKCIVVRCVLALFLPLHS